MLEVKKVPDEIVQHLLKEFLMACKQRMWLSYALWRSNNPRANQEVVQSMYDQGRERFIALAEENINKYQISQATLEWRGFCIFKQPRKYYHLEGIPANNNEINDFIYIGWPDPWPEPIMVQKRNLFAPMRFDKK